MMPGITISGYSFFSSILLFTIIILLVMFLRRNTLFIARHSINIILTMVAFALLRLLLPLDMYWAKVINSTHVIPLIKSILNQKVAATYTVKTCLLSLWAIGTIVYICYFLYVFVKDKMFLDKIVCMENTTLNNVIKNRNYKNIIVKVSPHIDTPKVWGIFTSHIYLPEFALSEEDWQNILNHEIQHIRNHDTLIKALFLVIVAIFWWNPVVYLLYREINYMLELRCDSSLAKNFNQAEQTSYLCTILNVLRQLNPDSTNKTHLTASLVNSSAYNLTKQRFEVVTDGTTPSHKTRFCWYFLITCLFFGSYFFIFQPAGYPTNADSYESEQTTFILLTKNKKYHLYVDGTFYEELSKEELKSPSYAQIEIIKED